MLTEQLKAIVGAAGFTSEKVDLQPHLQEWRDRWHGKTLLMVSPDSTEQVSAVVRACSEAGTAIVPQGGNTGLCGGAIPDSSGKQVLLSLSRLNQIRSITAQDFSLVAEAGCILESIQNAADAAGLFFPLSLAAEGSCQIGGNLSTNAGGINVLRYGTARNQALGLEVVLADGTIWNGLRSLRKDTAGYDLKQLFIGAEGTLGIITAACLRLYPAIKNANTVLLALPSAANAVAALAILRDELADQLQAFELIPQRAIRYVLRHIPSNTFPLELESPWYVLLETSNTEMNEVLERRLMTLHERGLASDIVIAKSRTEANDLWRLRHAISEAQKMEGASLKHDVSVPVNKVGEFLEAAEIAVHRLMPDVRTVPFGHVGDGNIHFNLSQPKKWPAEAFLAEREPLAEVIYDVVDSFGGSISAEHGIGQAKREHLRHYRGETEIALMRAIKSALDPANIMNPGKVI
jgi:FAD/FMN-containing dehydrogenase